jgi:hypothetical protein
MMNGSVGSRLDSWLEDEGLLAQATAKERLLDPANTTISLRTLARVAHFLGKEIEVYLVRRPRS